MSDVTPINEIVQTIEAKIAANSKRDVFDRHVVNRSVVAGLGVFNINRPGRARAKEHSVYRGMSRFSEERIQRILAKYGEFVGGFTWVIPERLV
jgi:hypothetical protein